MSAGEGAPRTLVYNLGGPVWAEALAKAAPGWRVLHEGDAADADIAGAEVLLGWAGRWAGLSTGPEAKLKWIQTASTGVDTLPLGDYEARGVLVSSAKGVHAAPVAETALGLMLAVARGFAFAAKCAEKRAWPQGDIPDISMARMRELGGKTLGLLGTGEIGRHLAGLCKTAFGMAVLGTSRSGRPVAGVDEMFPAETPEAMLARCDYVVNSLPGTPETEGYVNAERFAAMKQDAIYVNVGRGKTTDTDALVQALRGGHLLGAGLDVVDPEPLPKDSPLWTMDNVFIVPHYGGWSVENAARILRLFEENMAAYLQSGRPAKNLVDFGAGY